MNATVLPDTRPPSIRPERARGMPLPPGEELLDRIEAKPWLRIDDRDTFLKGLAFDRNDELTVMAASRGPLDSTMAARLRRRLLRISRRKEIHIVADVDGIRMCGHAIHRDGRIFVACLTGELLVLSPRGDRCAPIGSRWSGRPEKPGDLTFDAGGCLYVTDFTGHVGNPSGGVYRWTADFHSVVPLLPNLVTPNGIAFAQGERSMWVSCSWANEVIDIGLNEAHDTVRRAAVTYRLNGPPGGDGICVDVQGNVYLAVNFQGRVLVFNRHGLPIANVLMPGRDGGELTRTTSVAFRPGTDEIYVTASGESGGAWIYQFRGLAPGAPLFSHL